MKETHQLWSPDWEGFKVSAEPYPNPEPIPGIEAEGSQEYEEILNENGMVYVKENRPGPGRRARVEITIDEYLSGEYELWEG